MAGGFKWSLDWDTNPLRRGGKQAADAIEDAIDTFEDMARQADRSADKAGDALADETKSGARTAERALGDLEDAFRDTMRDAEKRTKSAADSLGDDMKRGAREAEQGMDDLNANAASNAKEFAASWDGSAQGAIDSLQGFVAEATEGFGPVGLAAGVALAAGAGAMYTAWQEKSEAVKQAIRAMYDDMLASGESYLSQDAIQTRISDIVNGAEDAVIGFGEVQRQSELLGTSVQTMLLAWAGNASAIEEVQGRVNEKLDETSRKFQSGDITRDAFAGTRYQLTDVADRLGDVTGQLDVASDGAATTRQAMRLLNREYADTPKTVTTDVDADTAPAHAQLDNLGRVIGSTHPVIPVTADTAEAERQMAEFLRKPRRVAITPMLGQRAV